MSYDVVHVFGSTVDFVFALLFLWTKGIARTDPGAGWWATSISCALLARLWLFWLLPAVDARSAIALYVFFVVLEKPFLLMGLKRFLNLSVPSRWFWMAALAGELWLLLTLAVDLPAPVRGLGYSLVNSGCLLFAARAALRQRAAVPGWPLPAAALACFLLALHWISAPLLIYFFPSWFRNGFVLGTLLVLAQYLSLLAAVLAQFQKRLLDAEARALDLALLDPLTGLNNKRYMNTLFDQALLLATRPHHVVAVFYIDLDNFKPINDTAGHAVGDEVLKTVAVRLKAHTRSTDICARVGGDEFVVIGTQLLNEDQATEVAQKLLDQMRTPIPVDGAHYSLGASIGIGLYPQHGNTLAQLIQCADQAMYEVKRDGKSGCAIYRAAAPAHARPAPGARPDGASPRAG